VRELRDPREESIPRSLATGGGGGDPTLPT
jgi:hypothetical protein